MYLSLIFENDSVAEFDATKGCFVKSHLPKGEKISGNISEVSGHLVALYCKHGQLYIQIDQQFWQLNLVRLGYSHNRQQKTTRFTLQDDTNKILIEYPAWWADIPDFIPMEPEMDEAEDYMGYLYAVASNKDLQRTLIEHWKN